MKTKYSLKESPQNSLVSPRIERFGRTSLALRNRTSALFVCSIALLFASTEANGQTINVRYRNNTTVNKSVRVEYRTPSNQTWQVVSSGAPHTDTNAAPGEYNATGIGANVNYELRVVYGDSGDLTPESVMTMENGNTIYVVTSASQQTTPFFEILPTVTLSVPDANALESQSYPAGASEIGTFRITRTGSTSSSLIVYFTMSGEAVLSPSYDFTLWSGSGWVTSSATIASGNSYVDIEVHAWYDGGGETAEAAVMTLSTNSSYSRGSSYFDDVLIAAD